MKKVTIICVVAVICFLPVSAALAQTFHLCWSAGGYGIDAYVSPKGGNVFEVNGNILGSTVSPIPIAGTLLVSGSNILLNFELIQAGTDRIAVVWDINLSLPSLGGSGYFRYFDSTGEGSIPSVTLIGCTQAEQVVGGDPTAVGIK